jgi:capsular exopolysaccharide synthesis family protein
MDDPSLQNYLGVLRRRRRLIIVAVLLGALGALAFSLVQTPRYTAKSELLLHRTPSEAILVDEVGQVRSSADSERELNNEIRLLESTTVRDAVDDEYNGPLDVKDVTAGAASSDSDDSIVVSMTSTSPEEAAKVVNLYTDTYITTRREQQVEDILAASDQIQGRLDEIRAEIAEVSQPLQDVEQQVLSSEPGSAERQGLEDERLRVMAEVMPRLAPLQSRESTFEGQLEQLQVTRDLTGSGGVQVLSQAEVPTSPSSPDTVANVVIGALIGLLAGIAGAFAADRLDDSVRSKDDAERITGLPTLGVIPKATDMQGDLATLQASSSPTAEAFRLLRTSVKFLSVESPVRTVVVTSAAPSEGKTVTAANLALVLSQKGERVLLVVADLRRPRAHELFGAPQSPGLTSVLLGESTPEAAIYAIEDMPGLHLLPPGPPPPNPAELLDSERARQVIAAAAERYDTVIIDSPPVLPVTDAQVLARAADAVLLVVAYRETSQRDLTRAVELLEQVDAPLIGTVLTLVPPKEGYGGGTYRYETYRSRSERRRERERASSASLPVPEHAMAVDATPDGRPVTSNGNGAGRHDPTSAHPVPSGESLAVPTEAPAPAWSPTPGSPTSPTSTYTDDGPDPSSRAER